MLAIPPISVAVRLIAICLLFASAPALAVDTLRVTTPDPFLDSWRWSSFELGAHCRDVFEDRDGNVWFALDGTIKRYDGYVWTTYRADEVSFPPNVRTIGQASDGVMW